VDAETRAVAERLRDAIIRRKARPCDGMRVCRDIDGVEYPDTIGRGAQDFRRAIPDLSAPATWGVLLGLLREHADDWQIESCEDGQALVLWTPRGSGDTVGGPDARAQVARPGVALALAILAAWGEP